MPTIQSPAKPADVPMIPAGTVRGISTSNGPISPVTSNLVDNTTKKIDLNLGIK